jgi:glycerol-3-phosphate dehydrogenase (NAD(P)+)
MDRAAYLDRARRRGVNPLLYWLVRGLFQPFFHLYFRMSRIGREHVLQDGPMIIAANHRSFLDPFILGTIIRRPVYFVAKKELFRKPLTAWFLNSLGAFPIDRGAADGDAMATAREILERGDVVVIFPEGTRVRPGTLGTPKRGVGRLALETGAPVLPVAVTGTDRIRTGWRIRPHKVRVRVGSPLRFPTVHDPSPALAKAVTDRIWPCVELQWEWLGGLAPLRRAALIGDTDVAEPLTAHGVEIGPLDPTTDLLVVATAARGLAPTLERLADQIPHRAGILLAPTDGPATPQALALAARTNARAVATMRADGAGVDSEDRGFTRQLNELLGDRTARATAAIASLDEARRNRVIAGR